MNKLTQFAIALTPLIAFAEAGLEEMCATDLHVMHASVRHTENKGVGYIDGYTTLEWFGIYDHDPQFMPFLDFRGHVFNDGKFAANLGIGERTLLPSIDHLFGLYATYDMRQENHGLHINQVGVGLELLGSRMEYRVNGYFPFGHHESHKYRHRFSRFEGNSVVLQYKQKHVMAGTDAEIGVHMTQSTRHDVYLGVGPYYFIADDSSLWGGKARLLWRYKDYISLEGSYSYDHVFKNIGQGTIAFSYPFGKKLKKKKEECTARENLAFARAAFAPHRFEIPVVHTKTHHHKAINPVTGQPQGVLFVNNTSHSAGTFESPFPTLAQAENASSPNDIIYVFPGDGTTTGMNAGIVLQDGQMLFGSGMPQYLETTVGRIKIPAFSQTAPRISSVGDCVTLGNGNEVAGFFITTDSSAVISGPLHTNGANIHNNVINPGVTGIGINGYGNLNIQDNVIFGNGFAFNFGVALSFADGQFTNANISGNQISNLGFGILLQPVHFSGTASGVVNVFENTVFHFGTRAIQVLNGMANSTFNMRNNLINDTASTGSGLGIFLSLTNAQDSGQYFIDSNQINTTTPSSGTTAISILSSFPTTARLSLTNNNILIGNGANDTAINVHMTAPAIYCTTFTNNNIQSLGGPGFTSMNIVAGPGIIVIDDLSNNSGVPKNITGGIQFAPPKSCRP
jgi:hypothetical protein